MSTIRRRLTNRLLLGWSLLLAVGSLATYLTARNALTSQFDDALRTRAIALTSAIEQDGGQITVDVDDSTLRDFDTTKSPAFYQIWRADGKVVARSPSLGEANLLLQHNLSPRPEFSDVRLANDRNLRAVGMSFRPHPADDSEHQSATVEAVLAVAADRRSLDGTLATLAMVLTGSAVLVLALTAVTLPWLLRRELTPLNLLADQTQRITADSLSERFPTNGLPGELAPISARLNDLLQRLQTAFERERQFSDDLAHEFRTPIAELRSLAELSLKWPDARNADTDQSVLAIALQMETIINRLLAIARSDLGRTMIELKRVDLTGIMATVCGRLQPRATARQLSFEADVPASLEVQSDPALLRSIMINLLDNAVEYSLPGGTVQMQAETRDSRFSLRVSNPVQQFSAGDMSHLFERFWRKDSARSGGRHSGLGLSLARAFATSLGCTLTASINGDSRLTMTLSGPVKPERPNQAVPTGNALS